jgi:peroxiredoxin
MMRVRLNLSIFALVYLLSVSAAFAGQISGFYISGKVKGLSDSEKIKLFLHAKSSINRNNSEEQWIEIASDISKGGQFFLKGTVPEGPREVNLIFDRVSKNGEQTSISFLLSNDDYIRITGSITPDLPIDKSLTIEGGKAMTDFLKTKGTLELASEILSNFNEGIVHPPGPHNTLMDKLDNSLGYNRLLMDYLEQTKAMYKSGVRQVLEEDSHNKAIPYLFDAYRSFQGEGIEHDSLWEGVYSRLDSSIKVSYYGKKMAKALCLCVGNVAPGFTSNTIDGKTLSLKKVLIDNKLTLVDFWASWCWGCIEQLRTSILPLYLKYHSKGFTVIGVSLDQDSAKWKKNIDANHFSFYNVSSLKGKDEPVYILYQTDYIPHNVLLDHEGKIIAWDVHGVELEWYLDKYLETGETESTTR